MEENGAGQEREHTTPDSIGRSTEQAGKCKNAASPKRSQLKHFGEAA
jgi:hypothetical protein